MALLLTAEEVLKALRNPQGGSGDGETERTEEDKEEKESSNGSSSKGSKEDKKESSKDSKDGKDGKDSKEDKKEEKESSKGKDNDGNGATGKVGSHAEEDIGEERKSEPKPLSEEIIDIEKECQNKDLLKEVINLSNTLKKKEHEANSSIMFSNRGKKFVPSRYGNRPDKCMTKSGNNLDGRGKASKTAIILISDESGSLGSGDVEVNKVINTLDIAEKMLYPKFTYEVCHLGTLFTHSSESMSPKSKDLKKLFVHARDGNVVPRTMFDKLLSIRRKLQKDNFDVYTIFMFDGDINTDYSLDAANTDEQIIGFKKIIDQQTFFISNKDMDNDLLFHQILSNPKAFEKHYLSTSDFVEEMKNKITKIIRDARFNAASL